MAKYWRTCGSTRSALAYAVARGEVRLVGGLERARIGALDGGREQRDALAGAPDPAGADADGDEAERHPEPDERARPPRVPRGGDRDRRRRRRRAGSATRACSSVFRARAEQRSAIAPRSTADGAVNAARRARRACTSRATVDRRWRRIRLRRLVRPRRRRRRGESLRDRSSGARAAARARSSVDSPSPNDGSDGDVSSIGCSREIGRRLRRRRRPARRARGGRLLLLLARDRLEQRRLRLLEVTRRRQRAPEREPQRHVVRPLGQPARGTPCTASSARSFATSASANSHRSAPDPSAPPGAASLCLRQP